MSLIRHQRMVCFDDDTSRFQMRAAGIALRDGHVLLQSADGDSHWALPGGRIEQGESSGETLLREMEEELLQRVAVQPLAYIVESFFVDGGRNFHEIGFYHPMTVPDSFPFLRGDVCHRIRDGANDVAFAWLPADEATLAAAPFMPAPLRPLLSRPAAGLIHILDRQAP
jgi:8-oxo-dGTP pyrophosphatase MutT (NUDIX family)